MCSSDLNHLEGDPKFGMQKELVDHIKTIFTVSRLRRLYLEGDYTFFGEGYGANIQKGGGLYRDDVGFILFDVVVHTENHDWWLKREAVEDIAKILEVPVVPMLGTSSKEEIVALVKSRFYSLATGSFFLRKKKIAEGIVATSYPLMLFRNGKPIKFKLKVKDYETK